MPALFYSGLYLDSVLYDNFGGDKNGIFRKITNTKKE